MPSVKIRRTAAAPTPVASVTAKIAGRDMNISEFARYCAGQDTYARVTQEQTLVFHEQYKAADEGGREQMFEQWMSDYMTLALNTLAPKAYPTGAEVTRLLKAAQEKDDKGRAKGLRSDEWKDTVEARCWMKCQQRFRYHVSRTGQKNANAGGGAATEEVELTRPQREALAGAYRTLPGANDVEKIDFAIAALRAIRAETVEAAKAMAKASRAK